MSTSKPRGASWKDSEDIALCISVITIGEDGDKATGQDKKKLSDRIHEVYLTVKPADGDDRSGGGYDTHWRKIRPACQR